MNPVVVAEARVWAREAGFAVGSRGALPAYVIQRYIRAMMIKQVVRGGRTAGRFAVSIAPDVARAVARRRAARQ